MQIEEELAQYSLKKETLVTIGVFDGVHLGHRYLISQLKAHAEKQNLLSAIVTFKQHPCKVLGIQPELVLLSNTTQKIELLKKEGVDIVVPLSFTQSLSNLSARQFLILLQKYLKMRGLLVGYDSTLGRNREGNTDMLRKLGQEMQFHVIEARCRKINGEIISSTAIRKAIGRGDKQRVWDMLGKEFKLDIARSCF
jgi:riboflavin kinase/FMN adenylyltransferase